MTDKGERLRAAAYSGSEVELKALISDPGCDPLSVSVDAMTALMSAARGGQERCIEILLPVSNTLAQDVHGLTALMWAAVSGHEKCIQLLLPTGNALARTASGLTASDWARKRKFEVAAQFIDAYVLAQNEKGSIKEAMGDGAPRGRAAPRM